MFLAEDGLSVMREKEGMTPFLDPILSVTEDANRRFERIESLQCDLSLGSMFYLCAVHAAPFHLSLR